MGVQRKTWADSLKGWLMLLVILGHAISCALKGDTDNNHVWNIIYSFHMPAFMAVSGYLTFRGTQVRSHGWRSIIIRRLRQLLVPYIAWSLIRFILSENHSLAQLLKIIVTPDSYFWFLWVLFFISIFFLLAQCLSTMSKISEAAILMLFCLGFMIAMVLTEFRLFGFQFIAYYFLFYTFGYFVHKFSWFQFSKLGFFILACLWFLLAWSWTMHGLPGWIPIIPFLPTSVLQYAYRGLTAVLAIVVLLGVSPHILDGEGKINKVVTSIGRVSLGMYVGHLMILGLIVNEIVSLWPTTHVVLVVFESTVLATSMAYLLVLLLEKNKLTKEILLGKI